MPFSSFEIWVLKMLIWGSVISTGIGLGGLLTGVIQIFRGKGRL